MRISDWSSDVCSSDLGDVVEEDGEQILPVDVARQRHRVRIVAERERAILDTDLFYRREEQLLKRDPGLSDLDFANLGPPVGTHDQQSRSCRSEEHTSELQSLMRRSYSLLCLKKKTQKHETHT